MDQRAVQQLLLQQLQSTGASEEAQSVPQPELNNLALQARHWAVAQQRKQEYDEQQRQQQAQWEAQKQRQEYQRQMQLQQQQQQQRNHQNRGGMWPNHQDQHQQYQPRGFNGNHSYQQRPRHGGNHPGRGIYQQNNQQQNQPRFQNTPRLEPQFNPQRHNAPTQRRPSHNNSYSQNRPTPQRNQIPKDLTADPDQAKNLPKWMKEEIARIQSTKPVEDLKEMETHQNEDLQKLADASSDENEEEEEEDWKEEVRKLSKDQQESDPELSDSEDVLIRKLTPEQIQDVKTDILRSSLQNILLSVTDDFIGKICRNALSRASSGQNTSKSQNSAGLGGLMGYGSGSSDDSDDEESDKNDSDWSVDSEKIRKKRKIFDREQRKRLKQFNIGSEDSSSTDDESQEWFLEDTISI